MITCKRKSIISAGNRLITLVNNGEGLNISVIMKGQ